jgi:hypothetical protein
LTITAQNDNLKLCLSPINPKRKKEKKLTALEKEWPLHMAVVFYPVEGEKKGKP